MTDTLTLDALAAVKEKQQATWASGDYAVIGTSLQIIGEQLCESVDVSAGQKVLDVAAGNGNAVARRRPSRVRRHRDRLRRVACSSGPVGGRTPTGSRSPRRWPTPRTSRSTTPASTSCCRPSA